MWLVSIQYMKGPDYLTYTPPDLEPFSNVTIYLKEFYNVHFRKEMN